jgi:ribonuclease HII
MTAQLAFNLVRDGLRAGVDEAGRGPLAGPVVAAAVILDPRRRIRGIRDSKVVEPEERAELAIKIRGGAIAWSVAWADVAEIDTLNILQATYLAMRRALLGLGVRPAHVQIDGDR